MNEIIKVNYDNDTPTVLGRDLHEFLGVKSKYADWFKNMSEYGFSENTDFITLSKNLENGGKMKDHQLTIEMAKEIAMLQRNEKGKQARQYFINLEKAWNTPEMVMSRALRMAENKITNLTLQIAQKEQIIGELQPKANYVDIILNNKGLVTVTQIAKDYGMSGEKMNRLLHNLGIQYFQSGQWLLYSKYHNNGYTHSNTIPIKHKDGTPDIKMQTKWTQKGRLFIYELLKENEIYPLIEQLDKVS